MDEEIERLVVSVRADTAGFARDVDAMRGTLEGPLEAGVDRAGKAIETTLLRAARTGKIGFDDLAKLAVQALTEIAKAAMGIGFPATGGSGAGPVGGLPSLLLGLLGLPGRATGGPVSPGRPYWVGERGPELFVPTSAGEVAAPAPGGGREVRVSITVNAAADAAPRALAQSSRQVARAVRSALAGLD